MEQIDAIWGLEVGEDTGKRNEAVARLKETAYVGAGCIGGVYRFKTIALAGDSS